MVKKNTLKYKSIKKEAPKKNNNKKSLNKLLRNVLNVWVYKLELCVFLLNISQFQEYRNWKVLIGYCSPEKKNKNKIIPVLSWWMNASMDSISLFRPQLTFPIWKCVNLIGWYIYFDFQCILYGGRAGGWNAKNGRISDCTLKCPFIDIL